MFPESWLQLKSSNWSFKQEPISVGIGPEKRLFERTSFVSELKDPKLGFGVPSIKLFERSTYWREERWPNSSGRNFRELECKSRNVKFRQPEISGGNAPVRWLFPRSRKTNFFKFPISGGISPASLLLLARNRNRDEQLPIVGGITPERLLERSRS